MRRLISLSALISRHTMQSPSSPNSLTILGWSRKQLEQKYKSASVDLVETFTGRSKTLIAEKGVSSRQRQPTLLLSGLVHRDLPGDLEENQSVAIHLLTVNAELLVHAHIWS
jgi:hypothetical protein